MPARSAIQSNVLNIRIFGMLRNKYRKPRKLMGSSYFLRGHQISVFSHNCIAYRKVAQHELMASHEVLDWIFDYISVDVRVI